MNLVEIAKRAAVRRVVYVLVAFALAWLGIGEARAATAVSPSCGPSSGCTLSEAYAAVEAMATDQTCIDWGQPATYKWHAWSGEFSVSGDRVNRNGRCRIPGGSYGGYNTATAYHNSQECPNPEAVMDPVTHVCGKTDAECQAINAQPGFIGVGETTRNFDTMCAANGCKFEAVNEPGQTAVVSVSGTPVAYTSQYEWTGACDSPPPPEAPPEDTFNADNTPPQYCVPGTAPQMCIKNDGEHCIAASTGKQLCWRPGETGTKYTGDTAQKRVPGTQPATAPTPPDGETFNQGSSVTATTTTGGTAVTTTTTNFTTAGGTEAGDVDQGEPDDGSGAPGSDQDGEEDPGSVTGGEGCETPPVVQGDPLLANIILQTWGTRCAAEDANAVTSTGEIGDCSSPFTVDGPATDPNVQKLKGIRAEICGGDVNADGQPDWTEGEAPGVPGEGDPADEVGPPAALNVGTDMLDMGGLLGAQTCPQLGVLDFGPFGTFDLNSEPVWCDLVALMRAIVLLMATFTAIKILMGGN